MINKKILDFLHSRIYPCLLISFLCERSGVTASNILQILGSYRTQLMEGYHCCTAKLMLYIYLPFFYFSSTKNYHTIFYVIACVFSYKIDVFFFSKNAVYWLTESHVDNNNNNKNNNNNNNKYTKTTKEMGRWFPGGRNRPRGLTLEMMIIKVIVLIIFNFRDSF